MLQLGDKGTTTWFKCLVCSRCYPVEEKLIVHKTTTNCRFHYAKAYKRHKRHHKLMKIWKRREGYAVSSDHSSTSDSSDSDSSGSSSGSDVIVEAVVPASRSSSAAASKRRRVSAGSDQLKQTKLPFGSQENPVIANEDGVDADDEREGDSQDHGETSLNQNTDSPSSPEDERLSSAETVVVPDPAPARGIKTIGGQCFTVSPNGVSALGTPSTLLTPVSEASVDVNSKVVSKPSASISKSQGGTKFACYFCSEECSTLGGLTRHMRKHTNEKEYKCRGCNAFFTYKHQMEHHQIKSRTCHL